MRKDTMLMQGGRRPLENCKLRRASPQLGKQVGRTQDCVIRQPRLRHCYEVLRPVPLLTELLPRKLLGQRALT